MKTIIYGSGGMLFRQCLTTALLSGVGYLGCAWTSTFGIMRKYLSYDNRKAIVQAIIMSRLDYCNGLLYGTPAVHLGKLQRLQNAAARLVCTVSRYDPITPSLINLHWLPVTHRIEFKIAMLVHKCIYGVAPQYLLDLIKIKERSRYQLRSYRGI